jgi:hypothetical protein
VADDLAAADPPAGPEPDRRAPGTGLERLASLRFTYFAIALFMLAYLASIDGVERALLASFRAGVEKRHRASIPRTADRHADPEPRLRPRLGVAVGALGRRARERRPC